MPTPRYEDMSRDEKLELLDWILARDEDEIERIIKNQNRWLVAVVGFILFVVMGTVILIKYG